MTNHVPTLETCQKLKAAGFPQTTIHAYVPYPTQDGHLLWSYLSQRGRVYGPHEYAAPILTEILEQLPNWRMFRGEVEDIPVVSIEVVGGTEARRYHKNPAEAAALLFLFLKEFEEDTR